MDSERRFQSLVEATTDWIWEIDTNKRYTYANPKVRNLLGYAPEEILGKTPFDLMPELEAARVGRLFESFFANHSPFASLLNINLHKDGHEVALETSAAPIFDNEGLFAGYRGFGHDVSGRMKTEDALQISRIHLSEAMDLAHIVCWQADPVTDTLTVDDAFLAFHGTSSAKEGGYRIARQHYVETFLHPDDHAKFHEVLNRCIEAPEKDYVTSYECRIIRPDGEIRQIITRIRVLKDAAGRMTRTYGTAQDITVHKKAEAEREKLVHDLQMALAEVKTLSGLLPTCSRCKRIRNQDGIWEQMEVYIRNHSEADFTHSICPECSKSLYPDI